MKKIKTIFFIMVVLGLLFNANAIAQEEQSNLIEDFEGEAALAQAAQNPIASMYSQMTHF